MLTTPYECESVFKSKRCLTACLFHCYKHKVCLTAGIKCLHVQVWMFQSYKHKVLTVNVCPSECPCQYTMYDILADEINELCITLLTELCIVFVNTSKQYMIIYSVNLLN